MLIAIFIVMTLYSQTKESLKVIEDKNILLQVENNALLYKMEKYECRLLREETVIQELKNNLIPLKNHNYMSLKNENSNQTNGNKKISTKSYSVPNIDTSFFAYMDYRTISDVTTKQWGLQLFAETDEKGLRKFKEYYLVAMGRSYSQEVGNKFRITLESGNRFQVMIGDVKNDIHTDISNQYVPMGENLGNLLEFIVDVKKLDKKVVELGDISGYEEFEGDIVKIEKIIEE